MKSKLIVICMFLLVLLSVCAVSAQDCENETQMTQISNDTLLADSSMTGNFDELKKEIDNAGTVKDNVGEKVTNTKLDFSQ